MARRSVLLPAVKVGLTLAGLAYAGPLGAGVAAVLGDGAAGALRRLLGAERADDLAVNLGSGVIAGACSELAGRLRGEPGDPVRRLLDTALLQAVALVEEAWRGSPEGTAATNGACELSAEALLFADLRRMLEARAARSRAEDVAADDPAADEDRLYRLVISEGEAGEAVAGSETAVLLREYHGAWQQRERGVAGLLALPGGQPVLAEPDPAFWPFVEAHLPRALRATATALAASGEHPAALAALQLTGLQEARRLLGAGGGNHARAEELLAGVATLLERQETATEWLGLVAAELGGVQAGLSRVQEGLAGVRRETSVLLEESRDYHARASRQAEAILAESRQLRGEGRAASRELLERMGRVETLLAELHRQAAPAAAVQPGSTPPLTAPSPARNALRLLQHLVRCQASTMPVAELRALAGLPGEDFEEALRWLRERDYVGGTARVLYPTERGEAALAVGEPPPDGAEGGDRAG